MNYLVISQIVLITLLIKPIKNRQYICNSNEYDLFKSKKLSINRLVFNKDTMYLVLDQKVIYLRMPKIHQKQNCLSELASVEKYEDNLSENLKRARVKGYSATWLNGKMEVQEIFNYKNGNESITELKLLKFSPIPAQHESGSILSRKLDDNSNYQILYETNKFKSILIYYPSILNILLRIESNPAFDTKMYLKTKVQKVVFFVDKQNIDDNVLIELDDKQKFTIKKFNFNFLINSSIWHLDEYTISLVDLLSCHRPFANFEQLKGIFFYEPLNLTFIFVNRFYVIINEDLVRTNFFIIQTDSIYSENAFNLEFENPEIEKKVIFENSKSNKLIKSYRDESYMKTFNLNFKLSVHPTERTIELKSLPDSLNLNCQKQTLNIDRYVFCFDSQTYFKMNDKPNLDVKLFKIEQLFENQPFKYGSNEQLEFIFNYRTDQVVFMTRINFFVFYYDLFSLNSKLDLVFNFKSNDRPFYKFKNCLFPLTDEQCGKFINNEPDLPIDRWISNMWVLILSSISVLICLLVCFLIIKNRKKINKKRKPDKLSCKIKINKIPKFDISNQIMDERKDRIAKKSNQAIRTRSSQKTGEFSVESNSIRPRNWMSMLSKQRIDLKKGFDEVFDIRI